MLYLKQGNSYIMTIDEEKEKIKQEELLQYIKNIEQNVWFPAYKDLPFQGAFYCVLINNEDIKKSLSDSSWDIGIGEGLPCCSRMSIKGNNEVKYYRYGKESMQPLVFVRNFNNIKPGYFEISEEFRHFHNLYFDKSSNRYIKIDENGDDEDVVVIENNTVKIKLTSIKQFLAIKKMSLLFLFDCRYNSKYSLKELSIKKQLIPLFRNGDIAYDYAITDMDWDFDDNKSFSRICGKKVIGGYSKENSNFWPYNQKPEEYDDFIIGTDENGNNVTYTSNPDELSNLWDKNPTTPLYLTPVFFKKEVLNKYYNDPNKYNVTDGYISCGNLWGLKIDNNKKEHVVVFLGDLGRDLRHKERLYWKSFNIPPDGSGISKVCWERSFEVKPSDPESLDLKFKYLFEIFNEKWNEKYGWDLFLPLDSDDKYHYHILHIPDNNQSSFDEQIRGLVKIIIDSLNEKKLDELNTEKATGSINKFKCYLEANDIENIKPHIEFLKNLQALRSASVAHRKGENYKKIAHVFCIGEKSYSDIYKNILNSVINIFEFLKESFLI